MIVVMVGAKDGDKLALVGFHPCKNGRSLPRINHDSGLPIMQRPNVIVFESGMGMIFSMASYLKEMGLHVNC